MFLTGCHEFPFPATRGHLPRRATFAPNRRWPLVAGTTVLSSYFQVLNPRTLLGEGGRVLLGGEGVEREGGCWGGRVL